MDTWTMIFGLVGASLSVGCVTIALWCVKQFSQGLKDKNSEEEALFLAAAIVFLFPPIFIGWWVPTEAWIITLVVVAAIAAALCLKRLINN